MINTDTEIKQLNIKNAKILKNFKLSGLEPESYLLACKQYLKERRINENSAVSNVAGLVDILNQDKDITLTEIYLILNRPALRNGFRNNETFLKIISNMENLLLVGVESYLSQILSLRSTNKEVTIWANDDIICDILNFDFTSYKNIKIKSVDIYDATKREETKFENIFYFPDFHSKRQFERGRYYGNDVSTIAVELLMKNLSKDGVLTAVMPSRVNSSMMEVHYRKVYGKHIMKVVRLPKDTLKNIVIKAYLYKFGTESKNTIFISDSLDNEGKEYYSEFVRRSRKELDLVWNFDNL